MTRLRLSPEGEQIVADWMGGASREDRDKMALVLESLDAGTWKNRWWNQPYPADRALWEIRPREGLQVFVREEPDDGAGLSFLDIDAIRVRS